MENLVFLIFYAFAFLFAISIHEYAHGEAAAAMGDPTPGWSGRLTLNPLAHLDLMGTLAFLISLQAGVGFGWAKPVPINPRYFRDVRRGLVVTGLAGPLANLTLAALFALPFRFLPAEMIEQSILLQFLSLNALVNSGLGIFNLIPVPPLDGSRVLTGLLPPRQAFQVARLEVYGPFILLLLLLTGILSAIMRPLLLLFWSLIGLY